MSTWKSNTYDGRYLSLSVTESSVDSINNRSTLSWVLTSAGGDSTYYSIAATNVIINGTTVYTKAQTPWSSYEFPAKKGSVSGTIIVNHNSDGSKTVNIGFSTRVYYSTAEEYGGTMTLTNIDRTAPTVSFSASNISSGGFKISASASVPADVWQYSLDGGTTWTTFSTTAGTAASITLTGLSPNTTYSTKVKARKQTNQIYGTSAATNVKTLGASILNSVDTITADDTTVTIDMNITNYNSSYYHNIKIYNGTTLILTSEAFQCSSGANDKTLTLTEAQRTILLTAMASIASFSGIVYLYTYSDSACSNQIGSVSSKTTTVQTTAENSAPTFSGFTYRDKHNSSVEFTQNNQRLIQYTALLEVTCSEGVANNESSISCYIISIGDISVTSQELTVNVGYIKMSGQQTISVKCVDSRNYVTERTIDVDILPYEKPKISSYKIRRQNDVDDIIQISFSSLFSSVVLDESESNNLALVEFMYKDKSDSYFTHSVTLLDYEEDASVTSETSGTYFTRSGTYSPYIYTTVMLPDDYVAGTTYYNRITNGTLSGTSFSFSSNEIASLDQNEMFDTRIEVTDNLRFVGWIDFVLPPGIPLVSLRGRNSTYDFKRVGIDNPTPTEALDVVGNVKMNGALVLGFVKELSGEGFNTLTSGGIYYYDPTTSSTNAPSTNPGFLEVLTDGSNVIHRFTEITAGCALIIRSYIAATEIWTAWTTK